MTTTKTSAKSTTETAKVTTKPTTTTETAKAATKTAKVVGEVRRSNTFKLTAKKFDAEKFGAGQRAAIAKTLNKLGGATRAVLIAKLPDVSPANISWHLSMMVRDKLVKKAA